jgi:hypothetical protein
VEKLTKIQIQRGLKIDLPVLDTGEPAFTTDTTELFIGSSSGNVKIGVGDMLISTYDTNNSGVVDDSEKLGGESPSYYLDRTNHTGSQAASTITADALNRFVNDSQISWWNSKQEALGFTAVPNTRTVNGKELSSNISITTSDIGAEPTLTKGNITEATSSVLTITGGTGSIIGSGVSIQVKKATTTTAGYLSSADWTAFDSKQAALGFTPENIANRNVAGGYATLDSNTMLVQNIDASNITTGTINIARIPKSALNVVKDVANQTARFALTISDVQNYDTVRQVDTGAMYWVVDDTNLDSALGYTVYTAGVASSVNWSGVISTPTTLSGYGITDAVPSTRTVNAKPLSTDITLSASDVGAEPTLTKGNLTEATSSVLTITGGTSSIIGSGTTIQVKQSSGSQSGFLSSTDWNTFNGKQAALGFTAVPNTRTINSKALSSDITLTTTDIGAEPAFAKNTAFNSNFETSTGNIKMNGTVSVGSLSTVARADHVHATDTSREPVLTKGNLTETNSNILTIVGGSGAVIGSGTTIRVSQATTSTSGFLSSTDWNTFNGKQAALGFTPVPNTRTVNSKALSANITLSASDVGAEPTLTKGNLTEATSSVLTINGGTGCLIGSGTTVQVKQASGSQSGFLSSTDWSTFNGKQAALGYTPVNKAGDTMTGVLTSTVATGTAPFVVASTTVVANLNASLLNGNSSSAFAAASHNQNWSTITNTPTTISGYGITDAGSLGYWRGSFNTFADLPSTGNSNGTVAFVIGEANFYSYLTATSSWKVIIPSGSASGIDGCAIEYIDNQTLKVVTGTLMLSGVACPIISDVTINWSNLASGQTKNANTWYFIYAKLNNGTGVVDFYISTNHPTLNGYGVTIDRPSKAVSKYDSNGGRFIGVFRTDALQNISPFKMIGNLVMTSLTGYNYIAQSVSSNKKTSVNVRTAVPIVSESAIIYAENLVTSSGNYYIGNIDAYGLILARASSSEFNINITPTNLLLPSTVTASASTGTAANGMDGDMSTAWTATATSNQWLKADLSVARSFNRAKIFENGSAITSFKIQYSTDNSTWNDLYTGTTTNKYQEITFNSISARYVKLLVITASANPSINELQVYTDELNAIYYLSSGSNMSIGVHGYYIHI